MTVNLIEKDMSTLPVVICDHDGVLLLSVLVLFGTIAFWGHPP